MLWRVLRRSKLALLILIVNVSVVIFAQDVEVRVINGIAVVLLLISIFLNWRLIKMDDRYEWLVDRVINTFERRKKEK